MNLYEGRKSKEEQVPEGEQKLETTTRGIQAALKRSKKADERREDKKLKAKLRKRELKQRAASEQRKREYFEWQKAQAAKREQGKAPKKEVISSKDTDASATTKTLQNIGRGLSSPEFKDFAKKAFKKGVVRPLSRTETGQRVKTFIKNREQKVKANQEAAAKKDERVQSVWDKGRGSTLKAIIRGRKKRVKQSSTPSTTPTPTPTSSPTSTPSPAPTPTSTSSPKKRFQGFKGGSKFSGFKGGPKGPSMKNESYFGTDDFENYLNESYSCWKEEFLMELGELRKKVKDKKVIDVMSGKNTITIGPTVSEEMNGASIFAKATPPMKKRTTPMSDIVLAKQPGKGTAERVRNKMAKLFLGNLQDYNPNYDYSLTPDSKSQEPNGD